VLSIDTDRKIASKLYRSDVTRLVIALKQQQKPKREEHAYVRGMGMSNWRGKRYKEKERHKCNITEK